MHNYYGLLETKKVDLLVYLFLCFVHPQRLELWTP